MQRMSGKDMIQLLPIRSIFGQQISNEGADDNLNIYILHTGWKRLEEPGAPAEKAIVAQCQPDNMRYKSEGG